MTTEAASQWLAETEAGDFKPVVHLVEVASRLAHAKTVPLARARDLVSERLRGDAAALFLAFDGSDAGAALVTGAIEWRPALGDGSQVLSAREQDQRAWQAAGLRYVGIPSLAAAEVLFRGLKLDDSNPGADVWVSDDELRQLPAVPAAKGRAGALDVWPLAAVPGAAVAAPDLVKGLNALAMFKADAARLFSEIAADLVQPVSFWDESPASAPTIAATPQQPLAIAAKLSALALSRKARAGPVEPIAVAARAAARSDYTDDEKQSVVKAYAEQVKSGGKRGAMQRLLAGWGTVLPGRQQVSRQTLAKNLAKWEKEAPAAQKSGAASSVFDLAKSTSSRQKQVAK